METVVTKVWITCHSYLGWEQYCLGEMERGAYYLHIMRAIEGIDMDNLEEKVVSFSYKCTRAHTNIVAGDEVRGLQHPGACS